MDFAACLADRSLTVKHKTEKLSQWMLANMDQVDRLVAFAKNASGKDKATCLQAFEYASRVKPEVGTRKCFEFAASALADGEPRVKWEAAKVVGNIARLHEERLVKAIDNLLDNASHPGTVVRWSAAFALGEIIKLRTPHNARLIPAADAFCGTERDNAIRSHYLKALKKVARSS